MSESETGGQTSGYRSQKLGEPTKLPAPPDIMGNDRASTPLALGAAAAGAQDAEAVALKSASSVSGAVGMGPLELATFRRLWRRSASFRHNLAETKAGRKRIATATGDQRGPITDWATDDDGVASRTEDSLATLRNPPTTANRTKEKGADRPGPLRPPALYPILPHCAAAALLVARVFDERPDLLASVRTGAPTIVIDVADEQMFDRVAVVWQEVLFDDPSRLEAIDSGNWRTWADLDAAYLVVKAPPKASHKDKTEEPTLRALSLGVPVIAISPMARTNLPDALNKAATARIEFPRLDGTVTARVIRIVTGRTCRASIDHATVARITLSDLVVAVRFDRTPGECASELRRLATAKETKTDARDLTLSDLHGLGEARAWAEAAIADMKAWKQGHIPSSEITSGIALHGPPGCGKTTFAAVFCREAGLHMVSATLAKWQSSGEAHLGHLLREMHRDFQEARTNIPACVFIDEIDSFADRAGVKHAYRDYVVEVVNALLAEVDGITGHGSEGFKGRDGVLVMGASNDIGRCDPALLRAGRLEKIVSIGLPDLAELERMFRVRLRGELEHEDLSSITELAVGMVGADVERIVKDARRIARLDGERSVTLRDLRNALAPQDDRPLEQRWRTCVHEAAHLVIDVIQFGPDGSYATTARIGSRAGMSVRMDTNQFVGTLDHYRRRLQVLLAGRAGEELLLGAASHGAGGVQGSDLDKATSLAAAMVGSLGLIDSNHLTYLGPSRDAEQLLAFEEVREAVARELAQATVACQGLLEANRDALETVARLLLADGRVDGAEVAALLAAHCPM